MLLLCAITLCWNVTGISASISCIIGQSISRIRVCAGSALVEAELDSLRDASHTEDVLNAAAAAMSLVNEVVFCHNDLLSGNILDCEADGRVQIIDFEYGA